ncbi:hypothetical protein J2N86_11515 [Legionella lytica]|uniref:Coiled-coil protein n=1 Tax=Legionella lytica TaxID=96232 RepID=A0ABY4Y762_9GAMM|nr:hypothetical protein [Legionella lytica]USQ13307.1 hypothetical protein J2N86_11515 [Legionella lytica]
MAHSLNDLITSLATILIRYHDSQGINVCIKESEPTAIKKASREYAMKLLQSTDFEQEFEKLNDECTKKYTERKDLLKFIKDEIVELKKISERTTPFSEGGSETDELSEYKDKVALLLFDFVNLLTTLKTAIYPVHVKVLNGPKETTLGLLGMKINTGFMYGFGMIKSSPLSPFCNSGDLLKEELLERFNLSEKSIRSEIKVVADLICEGHQHALMAAKHKELQTTTTSKPEAQDEQEISSLNTEIKLLEAKLSEKEEKLLQLQNTINELQQKIEVDAQESKVLESKLVEKEKALKEAEVTIEEQKLAMEKMQEELKSLKEAKARPSNSNNILPPFYTTSRFPYPLMYGITKAMRDEPKQGNTSSPLDEPHDATFDL